LTSKIHAVDTHGLPIRLALKAGEAQDNRLAGKLLSGLKSGTMLLADGGYDADWIRALATGRGRLGQYPAEMQSHDPVCFSLVSLPCPQFGRAIFQNQTVSSRRHSLPTTLPSSSLRPSGYGCAPMRPRPSPAWRPRT
jgi:transposase